MYGLFNLIFYTIIGLLSFHYLSFYLLYQSVGIYKPKEGRHRIETLENICLVQPRMGDYLKETIASLHDLGFIFHAIVTPEKSNANVMICIGMFSKPDTEDVAVISTMQPLGEATHFAPKCFTGFHRDVEGHSYEVTNSPSSLPPLSDPTEHRTQFPSVKDLFVLYHLHEMLLQEKGITQKGKPLPIEDITNVIPNGYLKEAESDILSGRRRKDKEGNFPLTTWGIMQMMVYRTFPLRFYFENRLLSTEKQIMARLQKNEQASDRKEGIKRVSQPHAPLGQVTDFKRRIYRVWGCGAFLTNMMPRDPRMLLLPGTIPIFLYLSATSTWPWTLQWVLTIFLGIPLYLLIMALGITMAVKKNVVFLQDNQTPKEEPYRDFLTRSILVAGHFYGSNQKRNYISEYVINKNCDIYPPVGSKPWVVSPNEEIVRNIWQNGPDHWMISMGKITPENLKTGWYYSSGRELFALQVRLENPSHEKQTMTYLIFESAKARDAVYFVLQQDYRAEVNLNKDVPSSMPIAA
jgi:hypothetical protein